MLSCNGPITDADVGNGPITDENELTVMKSYEPIIIEDMNHGQICIFILFYSAVLC